MRDEANESPVTAFSLESITSIQVLNKDRKKRRANHMGSGIVLPSVVYTLQVCERAQIEKKLASGPNVPATSGNAVEVNHQRLQKIHISHEIE